MWAMDAPSDSASAADAALYAAIDNTIDATSLCVGRKVSGKVRDIYDLGDKVILVATDRLSAFDRILTSVPYKGAILNSISAFWFNATEDIIPNHVLAIPHPMVTVARKCHPYKVEVVVRGYLTGSTSTSIWTHYSSGSRTYCGHNLPEGMKKNHKLPYIMCTPTTKDEDHDRPIDPSDIVKNGLMTSKEWAYVETKALELFRFASDVAAKQGLILVDTKYEFGKDSDGVIRIIDEMHTPDSSRFWLATTYEERITAELEPENVDKEFLRIWYREHCDPYKDEELPAAPATLIVELAKRYIKMYELLTGAAFPMKQFTTSYSVEAMRRSIAPVQVECDALILIVTDNPQYFDVVALGSLTPDTSQSVSQENKHKAAVEFCKHTGNSAAALSKVARRVSLSARRTVVLCDVTDEAFGAIVDEVVRENSDVITICCVMQGRPDDVTTLGSTHISDGRPLLYARSIADAAAFIRTLLMRW